MANTGSKGTTQSTVAVVSLTITMNGKSSSASSANVSQAENSYSDAWNTWVCTPNPTTISAAGGTSTLSGTARRYGTRTWSLGSTQPLDSGDQNVTSFSIVSPVSGFSISGAVVTATSNSSTSTKTVRVRSTYNS